MKPLCARESSPHPLPVAPASTNRHLGAMTNTTQQGLIEWAARLLIGQDVADPAAAARASDAEHDADAASPLSALRAGYADGKGR